MALAVFSFYFQRALQSMRTTLSASKKIAAAQLVYATSSTVEGSLNFVVTIGLPDSVSNLLHVCLVDE